MEMDSKNDGITLIALVVTIIVLLILAGITFTIYFEITEKAEFSRFAYEIGELKERITTKHFELKTIDLYKYNNDDYSGTINEYLGIGSRFNDYLIIVNRQLKYIYSKTPEKEREWLKKLGIPEIEHYYYIEFDANGGELYITKMFISSGDNLPIPNKVGFAFECWNTKQDGSGTIINPGEGVVELPINDGETIALYAQWKNYEYYIQNASFEGSEDSLIDTGICLYNQENVNKNFRIKFTVDDYDSSYENPENVSNADLYPTIMSTMYEKDNPYPGFVFRVMNNNNSSVYQMRLNNIKTGEFNSTFDILKPISVDIIRENGVMFLKINNGLFRKIFTYPTNLSEITMTDTPLTFGGNIDKNGKYNRFFKGKLSNISLEFFEDRIVENLNNQLLNNNRTYSESKTNNSYKLEGTVLFNGSNYIDTGLNLFSSENINKDFDIKFTINSIGVDGINNEKQGTVINLKDEALNNYPGVCYRYVNSDEMQFSARWPTQKDVNKNIKKTAPYTMNIYRRNNVIYYKINDENEQTLISIPQEAFKDNFDVNVTLGASLNDKHKPFRYFVGIVSDISIEIKE